MKTPALPLTLSLAVLLAANVLAQDQVQIQFQTDPVLVQTGTDAVFTVQTVSQVLSMGWSYEGLALGVWTGGNSVVQTPPQFTGRVTITNTQLRVGSTQLGDAGTYTVQVTPSPSTGLVANSRSVQLRVFDAVAGVSLTVPTVAIEGRNVSLSCRWTAGTETSVQWGKAGVAITPDSRINISGGSLVINPARRGDAGEYTCTVSNLVSAQTARQSLTIYYGPDTPVLTKESPKDCVGGGDVLVGQRVVLTCRSDSLPPATFTWQRGGQTVATGQPGSGVLSLQTLSTNESGRYVCTATNSITTGTSEQGTDLAVVDVCLDGGEVAGIVIGCFLLLVIIILLIVLIVVLIRRRRAERRRRETVFVQKSNPDIRPVPPDPLPNGARDLGQGPQPPLYHLNTQTRHHERFYAEPRESRGNSQMLLLNGLHNSDTHQHNDRTHTNGLLHDSIHNKNSNPHNGIDNPAFTHTVAQNANTLPNSQQQNPNILIQTGTAQGGSQPAAVHVSLNGQSNSNAPQPTIHVNLNSYPTNGQQTQPDNSFPFTNTANNNPQTQPNLINTDQSSPRLQGGQSYRTDPRANGFIEAGHRDQSGLIPTGFTHFNPNNTSQRNARTQTNPEELEPRSRSAANLSRHETTASSSHQQRPWDLLQGTPSYPSGTLQRRQPPPEYASDTDYTTHPPIRETRTPNRSRPESRATSRSRATPRRDDLSLDRERRSRSADLRGLNTISLPLLEAAHRKQRSPLTQREPAQRDIRVSPGSQSAPRQEATHSNNPQAHPLMSQQVSVGRPALSQGPTTQQGLTAPQGADTRALADPNHLPQAHMAQQQRAAPIQKTPQGLGTQRQPVIDGANQLRQGGTAPVPQPPAQHNPSNLTQAALSAHTQRAQTFQNRNQQTQAALMHPGQQAGADARQPPIPPPVIPLTQFQTLPEKRSQHRSPIRGPQPPRPPVNVPVAQRHPHRHNGQHHPANHPHHHQHHQHHHGQGHTHGGAHRQAHARGPGNPAHFTHPRQQQTHRERPRR